MRRGLDAARTAAALRSAAMASSGPETTHCCGPVHGGQDTSATEQRRRAPLRAEQTASIAPGGSACISRPRAATSARRVLEREHAGQARRHVLADAVAEHRRRARCPRRIQSRASAYSTTNSAGWVSRVSVRRRGRASSAASADRAPRAGRSPRCRAQDLAAVVDVGAEDGLGLVEAAAHVRRTAALAGEQEGDGRSPVRRAARATALGDRPRASSAAASGLSRHTDDAAVGEGAAADLQRVGDVGEAQLGVLVQVSRPGCCAGALERRVGVFAESTQELAGVGVDGRRAPRGGASSSTTCALVPPMPNELTPARRGRRSRRPLARARRSRRTGCRRNRSAGSGVSKCRLGGISRCSSASTALIRPATPAAASRWPMLRLHRADGAEAAAGPSPRGTPAVSAATSIGIAERVPVPCAST